MGHGKKITSRLALLLLNPLYYEKSFSSFIAAITLFPVFAPPALHKIIGSAVPTSDLEILFHNDEKIYRKKITDQRI